MAGDAIGHVILPGIVIGFFIAGTLKIAYDLLLYRAFVRLEPPEESL